MVEIHIEEIRQKRKEVLEKLKAKGIVTDELLRQQADNLNRITQMRGEVLSSTIDLEYSLDRFFEAYFILGMRGHITFELWKHMRKTGFRTFERKIDLFDKIGYFKKEEFGNKYNDLPALLHKIRFDRNLVAHGFIVNYTEPKIRRSDTVEVITLDEKFIGDFRDRLEVCFESLARLKDRLAYQRVAESTKLPGSD